MAATRPYFVVFRGEQHIIDAPSAAHAVQHIVGADVAELRPARAAEVSAWVRANKAIPMAGEKLPVAAAATLAPQGEVVAIDVDGFTVADAAAWLSDALGETTVDKANRVTEAWRRMVAAKRLTLEDFDIIRTDAPEFAEALSILPDAPSADVGMMRARLEDEPMSLDLVVEAIAQQRLKEATIASLPQADVAEEPSS